MNTTRDFKTKVMDENMRIFHQIASTLLSSFGIATNLVCLSAIFYSGVNRRLSTSFFINIVVIDFLISSITMLSAAVKSFTLRSFRDDVWCDVTGYITNSLIGAEISGLALISANCYAMIVPANRIRKFFDNKRDVYILLAVSHAIPLSVLLLPVFGVWGKFSHGKDSGICTAYRGDDYFGTCIISVSLATNFTVIIISYVGIMKTFWKSRRKIEDSRQVANLTANRIKTGKQRQFAHRKLLISVVSMVISFVILYIPTGLSLIIDPQTSKWNTHVHVCLSYASMSHCVVNTLVYTLTNAVLRKAAGALVRCLPCRARRDNVSNGEIHNHPSVTNITT